MWTRAKSVLGTIVLALAAEPFVWLLNDWRDAHKDSLPAWRETAGAMLDLIPPYVLWTFAAGATFAFVVLRGWRRPSVAPSASGGEEKGPRSGTAAPALSP